MTQDQHYDWTEFKLHHYYQCSRREVFLSWATSVGLESFFIGKSSFSGKDNVVRSSDEIAQPGDTYTWDWIHEYSLEGKIIDVVEDERVSFTFGSMTVTISIQEVDNKVLLTLHQTEIPVDDDANKAWSHLNCRSCWAHYLTNLKAVIEHGMDLRDQDPHKADCISIGFVPQVK